MLYLKLSDRLQKEIQFKLLKLEQDSRSSFKVVGNIDDWNHILYY